MHIIGRTDLGIYYGQNIIVILEVIQNIDCKINIYFGFDFVFSFQSIELRNKMFAKELRRGKALSNNQTSPKLPTVDQLPGYCFDGKILILNYLTYQYVDLTYTPLQEIVNYPGGIRLGASVKAYSHYLLISFRKKKDGIQKGLQKNLEI